MDDFTYMEAEKFNITNDMRAPLVAKEQQIDVSNKIHFIELGDKCVPASRFKLRTRQTIKNMNGCATKIEMDDFHHLEQRVQWSEQTYTFKEMKKLLAEERPLLAKLESGFSNEILELARSQILLLSDCGVESRATVFHGNGSQLSFPLEFPVQIIHEQKEYNSFKELLALKKLPLEIELRNKNLNSLNLQHLTFKSIKEHIFINACTIAYGWVDQSELLILPELSQIEFKVAKGVPNANTGDWRDYKDMLRRSTRHLHLQSARYYTGILYEKEAPGACHSELNDVSYYNGSQTYEAILSGPSHASTSPYINDVKTELLYASEISCLAATLGDAGGSGQTQTPTPFNGQKHEKEEKARNIRLPNPAFEKQFKINSDETNNKLQPRLATTGNGQLPAPKQKNNFDYVNGDKNIENRKPPLLNYVNTGICANISWQDKGNTNIENVDKTSNILIPIAAKLGHANLENPVNSEPAYENIYFRRQTIGPQTNKNVISIDNSLGRVTYASPSPKKSHEGNVLPVKEKPKVQTKSQPTINDAHSAKDSCKSLYPKKKKVPTATLR